MKTGRWELDRRCLANLPERALPERARWHSQTAAQHRGNHEEGSETRLPKRSVAFHPPPFAAAAFRNAGREKRDGREEHEGGRGMEGSSRTTSNTT